MTEEMDQVWGILRANEMHGPDCQLLAVVKAQRYTGVALAQKPCTCWLRPRREDGTLVAQEGDWVEFLHPERGDWTVGRVLGIRREDGNEWAYVQEPHQGVSGSPVYKSPRERLVVK